MSKYVIMSDKHRSIYGDNFVEFWGKNFDGEGEITDRGEIAYFEDNM